MHTFLLYVQSIRIQFTTLRLTVEDRLKEKQKLIVKLDIQLQKDIIALIDKLSEVINEVTVSTLFYRNINF